PGKRSGTRGRARGTRGGGRGHRARSSPRPAGSGSPRSGSRSRGSSGRPSVPSPPPDEREEGDAEDQDPGHEGPVQADGQPQVHDDGAEAEEHGEEEQGGERRLHRQAGSRP